MIKNNLASGQYDQEQSCFVVYESGCDAAFFPTLNFEIGYELHLPFQEAMMSSDQKKDLALEV